MAYKIPFKEIAETVSIYDVAEMNGVHVDRKNRAKCPACGGNSDNTLELKPETKTFICYAAAAPTGKKNLSGDCIALHAHLNGYPGQFRAAKELHEQFGGANNSPNISNEKVGNNPPIKPSREPFDPAAFAEKLEYSEEVKATGLSEDDAKALGVGTYRGKLYQALRYPSGAIAGYSYVEGGKLKPPKNLLPDSARVVQFPKRA